MVWVDNARILMIFLVVLAHVAASIVISETNFSSSQWLIANFYDGLCKCSVPVFVMVSGALLLAENRTESMSVFYRKRAVKLLGPLLFWSFFYTAWNHLGRLASGNTTSLLSACKTLLSGKPYYHMWFMYMIVCLYLFTPFIRTIVRNTTKNELLLFVLFSFAIAFANTAFDRLMGIKDLLFLNWFLSYVPYFILGHIIATSEGDPSKFLLLLIFILSVIFTGIGCYLLSKYSGNVEVGGYFYESFSVTVIPMSISIIYLLKKLTMPIVINKRITSQFAGLVLGIYLIHPLILEFLKHFGIFSPNYHALIGVPLIATATYTISAIISWLIRKTPYLERII